MRQVCGRTVASVDSRSLKGYSLIGRETESEVLNQVILVMNVLIAQLSMLSMHYPGIERLPWTSFECLGVGSSGVIV